MAYVAIRKKRRLSNPGRKRLTAKQIKYFGTARQRAALRRRKPRRRNISIRKAFSGATGRLLYEKGKAKKWGRGTRRAKRLRAGKRTKNRRGNIGSILVASIPGNPGRKRRKNKVARRRRRNRARVVRHRRHRRHYTSRRRRRSNPGYRTRSRTRVVYRRRGRRHHARGRRRNPSFGGMGGDISTVAGIITGAAVTRLATGMVPPQWNTGIAGYVITAVVAVMQGQLVGKLLKKPAFGKYMTWGGLTYLGLKVINDMVPSLSGYLPFGLSGLGVISPSAGFFSPQVNKFGSMGSYITPGTITQAIAAAGVPKASGMHGIGDTSMSSRRT